jgi:2,4-dienoyl-CoA reductase-like NADH-dependent reductase (Old Yellow Enzyme family)
MTRQQCLTCVARRRDAPLRHAQPRERTHSENRTCPDCGRREGHDVTTAASDRYDRIAAPLDLAHRTLRNRAVMASHTVLFGEDHLLSDRHIAYYRERALGGVGMVIAEGGSVHPSSRGAFKNSVSAIDPRAIPRYERLADTLHALDTTLMVQIFHIGVHMHGFYDHDAWTPLWGPSHVASPRNMEIPMAMEQAHIDELIAGHADAAANLQLAGVDGVELHAAHSYLLGQFLSPAYNRRTDGYGGSPRQRARIVREAAEAVRARVGPDFIIGVRLSFDEWLGDAGITPADSEEILDELASSGVIDLFNMSGGGYHSMFRTVAPMTTPGGYMAPFGAATKRVVGDRAAVMLVGRINDLELADRLVAEEATDLVGMTRALMADPALVAKSLARDEPDVVRCVGANHCNQSDPMISCLMNPAMGRERRWGTGTLTRVRTVDARHVVVAGGGPAGMKVAGVAAARGHRVTLLEAGDELGGHLDLLRRMPTRDGWKLAIAGLRRPLEREGVEVRLGTTATVELARELRADVLVCATGSSWDGTGASPLRPERPGIPGADQDNVLDVAAACRRVLADPAALGGRVLIVDETGQYLAVGLADLLAQAGVHVELVSPLAEVGSGLNGTNDAPYVFPRLVAMGVALTPQTAVERIDGDAVTFRRQWHADAEARRFDTVVLSMGRTPDDGLYYAARDAGLDVRRLGDAVAPRSTAVAIYEGEDLGRAL